jgi:hypothetical protein
MLGTRGGNEIKGENSRFQVVLGAVKRAKIHDMEYLQAATRVLFEDISRASGQGDSQPHPRRYGRSKIDTNGDPYRFDKGARMRIITIAC